ncbi:MAG TPA: hypothetical protein VLQ48_14360 [Chloroflexia bacterium]|nr:hypothetical protein [Chloroflexia bacterium]
MKQKYVFLLVGAGACLALGVLAVIWYVTQSTPSTTATPGSMLADGTIAPPNTETLVLYPSAYDVSHEKQHPEDWAALSFATDAPAKDVLKFYADYLSQNRWSMDQSSKVGIGARPVSEPVTFVETNAYVWRDRANTVPWTLALTLSVQEIGEASAKKSNVAMVLNRIPSLTHLPMYPGAEQVLYVTEPPATREDNGDRRTTYVTGATPEQVLAFYQGVLPQCGWQTGQDSATSANVLHYRWSMKNLDFVAPDPNAVSDYFLAIKAEAAGPAGNTSATNVTIDVNASHGDYIYLSVTP